MLREQLGILHRRLLAIVRDDEVCRRQRRAAWVPFCLAFGRDQPRPHFANLGPKVSEYSANGSGAYLPSDRPLRDFPELLCLPFTVIYSA